jgi:dTDP-4-dehydrorhamnose reductase
MSCESGYHMSQWVITGAGGLLGRELTAFLLGLKGEKVIALDHRALDILDRDSVENVICETAGDVVVNCAAWTAANEAEERELDALAVNGYGVENLAGACLKSGSSLVHISTDYVFDGMAVHPYSEHSVPRPRNAYGRTKLIGERAVLAMLPENGYVVRTAWLYGRYGPNFVCTMINLEAQRPTVEVVDDQLGQPTWARDLASQIFSLHWTKAPAGVYHGSSSGQTTWCGLAREVFTLLGADPGRVRAITSKQRGDRAARPAYSVLGHERWAQAGLEPLPDWKCALRAAFPVLTEAQSCGLGLPSLRARRSGGVRLGDEGSARPWPRPPSASSSPWSRSAGNGRQVGMDRRDMLGLLQLDRRTDRILPNGYCLLPSARSCDKGNACHGCGHFATDRSHLPEIRRQLAATGQLIQQRQEQHARCPLWRAGERLQHLARTAPCRSPQHAPGESGHRVDRAGEQRRERVRASV